MVRSGYNEGGHRSSKAVSGDSQDPVVYLWTGGQYFSWSNSIFRWIKVGRDPESSYSSLFPLLTPLSMCNILMASHVSSSVSQGLGRCSCEGTLTRGHGG